MDNLKVYIHADRIPICSLWGRCVACGWMWRSVCASTLQHSNQSLNHAPAALCNASRVHEYRKWLSTLSIRRAPHHRHLKTRPQCDGCARFDRLSISNQRPCAFPTSRTARGRRSDLILTTVDRWMLTSIFRQNSWNPVPMALCRSQCPVLDTLITCVADSSACASAATDKKLEGSSAPSADAYICSHLTPRTRHATLTHQHKEAS